MNIKTLIEKLEKLEGVSANWLAEDYELAESGLLSKPHLSIRLTVHRHTDDAETVEITRIGQVDEILLGCVVLNKEHDSDADGNRCSWWDVLPAQLDSSARKQYAVICKREYYGPSVRQEIVRAHGGTDKPLLFDSPREAREWIAEMESGLVLEAAEYRRSYQVTTVGSARWEKLGGRA